jgi:hypothetical protein
MLPIRRFTGPGVLGCLLVASLHGCGADVDAPEEEEGTEPARASEQLRYTREFIFVSPDEGDPTVVPFAFRAIDDGSAIERTATAWLGRGSTWDRFLDESHTGSRAGGVWRVVPQGDLSIAAGGSVELETFRFERDERRLRLDLADPVTPWTEAGDTRFRLLSGRLAIGPETLAGLVLEVLSIERTLDDGWPPSHDYDSLFLTSGDSIQLVLAESVGSDDANDGHAWIRSGSTEGSGTGAEIRWLEMRPLQEARRDVPRRWSFRIPGYGIDGEVEAVGQDVLLGPERGGRRAVEIRYGVTGWFEVDGARRSVVGMIRHLQQ